MEIVQDQKGEVRKQVDGPDTARAMKNQDMSIRVPEEVWASDSVVDSEEGWEGAGDRAGGSGTGEKNRNRRPHCKSVDYHTEYPGNN